MKKIVAFVTAPAAVPASKNSFVTHYGYDAATLTLGYRF